jgi:hypothetical protein
MFPHDQLGCPNGTFFVPLATASSTGILLYVSVLNKSLAPGFLSRETAATHQADRNQQPKQEYRYWRKIDSTSER